MTQMQEAIERQIESYRKIKGSIERDAKKETDMTLRNMSHAQAIVLKYVIQDLKNIIHLFGEESK